MKSFDDYILEKNEFIFGGEGNLRGTEFTPQIKFTPKDKDELRALMKKLRNERGECGDFNDIDVSGLTDMSELFYSKSPVSPEFALELFNGDISLWDTSNVKNMRSMFNTAKNFNYDISLWDVSNVNNMYCMFNNAYKFDCDISSWDVSSVVDMRHMFSGAKNFKQDLNSWKVKKGAVTTSMFNNSGIEKDTPIWYIQ